MRLKPDSLDHVRAWAAELNGRGDEVLATLRDEDVVVESVFLDQTSTWALPASGGPEDSTWEGWTTPFGAVPEGGKLEGAPARRVLHRRGEPRAEPSPPARNPRPSSLCLRRRSPHTGLVRRCRVVPSRRRVAELSNSPPPDGKEVRGRSRRSQKWAETRPVRPDRQHPEDAQHEAGAPGAVGTSAGPTHEDPEHDGDCYCGKCKADQPIRPMNGYFAEHPRRVQNSRNDERRASGESHAWKGTRSECCFGHERTISP